MKERFALLLSSMEKEWETVSHLAEKIISKKGVLDKGNSKPSPEETVFIAYQIHNIYGALEEIFKQITQTFENSLDDSGRFHAGLLKKMSIDIYKIRPRFLSDNTFRVLDEARRFRHLFRHAYEYEHWDDIEKDKKSFIEFLIREINRE
jgi:hypothetical protein